jgi:hypothetical protein
MTLPVVSDHAVLRFLQRVQGIDIEKVRQHIATTCAPAIAAGAVTLKADGAQYCFRNGAVITVRHASVHPCRTRRDMCAKGRR